MPPWTCSARQQIFRSFILYSSIHVFVYLKASADSRDEGPCVSVRSAGRVPALGGDRGRVDPAPLRGVSQAVREKVAPDITPRPPAPTGRAAQAQVCAQGSPGPGPGGRLGPHAQGGVRTGLCPADPGGPPAGGVGAAGSGVCWGNKLGPQSPPPPEFHGSLQLASVWPGLCHMTLSAQRAGRWSSLQADGPVMDGKPRIGKWLLCLPPVTDASVLGTWSRWRAALWASLGPSCLSAPSPSSRHPWEGAQEERCCAPPTLVCAHPGPLPQDRTGLGLGGRVLSAPGTILSPALRLLSWS